MTTTTHIQTENEFRDAVLSFYEAQQTAKALRTRLAELKGRLLDFMKSHDIDECQLPDSTKLVRKRSKKTEPLKKDHISSEIRKLVPTAAAADEVLNNMLSRRATEDTETLSLVKRARVATDDV